MPWWQKKIKRIKAAHSPRKHEHTENTEIKNTRHSSSRPQISQIYTDFFIFQHSAFSIHSSFIIFYIKNKPRTMATQMDMDK